MKKDNLNIPIYRAKIKDSDEWVEGYLFEVENYGTTLFIGKVFSYLEITDEATEIDPSTLAIHFNDMKDSEGTKIFASLSKDGKGGDRWDYIDHDCDTMRHIVVFDKETLAIGLIDLVNKDWQEFLFDITDDFKARSKVTGIQS